MVHWWRRFEVHEKIKHPYIHADLRAHCNYEHIGLIVALKTCLQSKFCSKLLHVPVAFKTFAIATGCSKTAACTTIKMFNCICALIACWRRATYGHVSNMRLWAFFLSWLAAMRCGEPHRTIRIEVRWHTFWRVWTWWEIVLLFSSTSKSFSFPPFHYNLVVNGWSF